MRYLIPKKNICQSCRNAKDKFRESCYCVQYGIIVTYGKTKCKGYEREDHNEEIPAERRESEIKDSGC